MTLLLLVGIALAGLAAALALRTFAFAGVRKRETLAQIEAYGFRGAAPVAVPPRSLKDRLDALAGALGTPFANGMRPEKREELRRLIRGAGHYGLRVETLVGYRVLGAAGLPALWLWLAAGSGSLSVRIVALIALGGAVGWTAPTFFLKRQVAKRIHAIDMEMPELVDLLVTTVEAGVGFAASLQLVARRVEGPLGQELRLALQEQAMGITIEEALENMLARVDSMSVRAFVQAIVQGQTLGVPIGRILRDLATEMRKIRRQKAEERAQKSPTKILFPLVAFILPALFIVALGGPIIGLTHQLGAAGG
jgi:tight adherence protein C